MESVYQKLLGRGPLHDLLDKAQPLFSAFRYLDEKWKEISWLVSFPDEPAGLKDAFDSVEKILEVPDKINGIFEFLAGMRKLENKDGFDGNPSKDIGKYKIEEFYWNAERESQWTRATYPYVNDYRSGILKLMKDHLWRSNLATYYAKWTNRYTLANSYSIRVEPSKPESKNEYEVFGQLKLKIKKLRREFDDAIDSSDEEASGSIGVAPFEEISEKLVAIVRDSPVPEAFESWKQRVLKHQEDAESIGNSLSASPDDDISDENLKALGTQIARINLLDELLTLLEEIIDSIDRKPPHMYVLDQMDGKNKGDEPWTNDSALADELFCLRATAKRKKQLILMSPIFFTQHLSGERSTVAQSMLYNANGRSLKSKTDTRLQINTGWDTLNWEPPVQAFEWGKHEPNMESDSTTAIFLKGKALKQQAKSRMNWQSKLVPIVNATRKSS